MKQPVLAIYAHGLLFSGQRFASETLVQGLRSRGWGVSVIYAKDWEKLQVDIKLRFRFNLDGNFHFCEMLQAQMNGESDSWAIRWYWSVFKNHGLAVYSPFSYVNNTGFDGSGTHGSWSARRKLISSLPSQKVVNLAFPEKIKVSELEYRLVKKFLNNLVPKWVILIKKLLGFKATSFLRKILKA